MAAPQKILFVDDDPEFLAAIQRAFRHQFPLDVACSGPEALERFATSGPYAVIVADLAMPGMGGIELLRSVSEKFPDTIQVVLTGDAGLDALAESVNRTNVFRYVVKSFDGENLRATLIDALREFLRRSTDGGQHGV